MLTATLNATVFIVPMMKMAKKRKIKDECHENRQRHPLPGLSFVYATDFLRRLCAAASQDGSGEATANGLSGVSGVSGVSACRGLSARSCLQRHMRSADIHGLFDRTTQTDHAGGRA